jgi:hypothetical protein
MPAMRRLGLLAACLSLAMGLALAAPALVEAHRGAKADVLTTPAPTPVAVAEPTHLVWSSAPAAPIPPWPLLAALFALALAGARSPRRALALSLVLIVSVFAFESGVHSVHHLVDGDRGESCAVASASQHIAGTEVDAVLGVEALPQARQLAATDALIERVRLIGPDQGRAPPALPA